MSLRIDSDAQGIAVQRTTKETDIRCRLQVRGSGEIQVDTGLGFFDHMLGALALHAGFDLELCCQGDRHVDDHHTVEDCALVLGAAIKAYRQQQPIARFGWALIPMDEALARAAVDMCGRPWAEVELQLVRPAIGQVACENLNHFFVSFAMAAEACIHLTVLQGANDHHRAEAAFKALAYALRQAHAAAPASTPSTKGVLT